MQLLCIVTCITYKKDKNCHCAEVLHHEGVWEEWRLVVGFMLWLLCFEGESSNAHWTEDWMGLRDDLDVVVKENVCFCQTWKTVFQPAASHLRECVTLTYVLLSKNHIGGLAQCTSFKTDLLNLMLLLGLFQIIFCNDCSVG